MKTQDMSTYNYNNVINLLKHSPESFIYHLISNLSARELITLAGKLNGANLIIGFHAKLLEEKTAIQLLRKKIVQYNFHFLEKAIELKAEEDVNLFIEKFLKKKKKEGLKKHG